MKLREFLEETVFDFDRYEVAFGIPARVAAIFLDREQLCGVFGDYKVEKVAASEVERNSIQFVLESDFNRELRDYVDTKREESYVVEFERGIDALKTLFTGTDVFEYLDEYGAYLSKHRKKIYVRKSGKVDMRSLNAFWKWMHRTHPF